MEIKSDLHSLDQEKQSFIIKLSKQSPRTKGDFFAQSDTNSEPSEISPQPAQPNPSDLLKQFPLLSLFLLVVLFLLGAFLLPWLNSIKIISEGNEALVERFGRYNRKLTSGPNRVIPFIETIVCEDTIREKPLRLELKNSLSKDGVPMEIESFVHWKIIDLERAYYVVEDIIGLISDLVNSELRALLASFDAENALLSHRTISDGFRERINRSSEIWGVIVVRLEIKRISAASSFMEALERRATSQILQSVDGDTLNLPFENGIDGQAFQYSWNKLKIENEGIELKIVGLEEREDGFVVVKVKVPTDSDAPKLYHDFMKNYESMVHAIEEKYRAELEGKDAQIEIYKSSVLTVERIVTQLASRPQGEQTYNISSVNTSETKALMDNNSDQSRKIEIGSVGHDLTASGAAFNLGEISDTVANTINQLSESSSSEQTSIKSILQQLHQLFTGDENLTEEDKAEALEQLKILAKASQNPTEGTMRKAAKTAMKVLRGTIAALPPTVAIVKVCNELLPKLVEFLGLG
ncbi:MAG: SPFH domain-containing protein [Cyanobacteria bacterium P01_G01_bin.54]